MQTKLRIQTFGGVDIRLNGEPVTGLASRKAEALLVYLACTKRQHAREILADLLWDELTRQRSLGNLSVLLTSLRQQVGPFLDVRRQTVGLLAEAHVWVDALMLEAQVRVSALSAPEAVLQPAHITQLEQALGLYHGDFLQGFALRDGANFEQWVLVEQERLRQLVVGTRTALVRTYLQNGSYEAGIAQANRQLQIEPLHEETHLYLLRLLALSGQRGAALAHYTRYRQQLASELGVQPASAIEAMHQQIRNGELYGSPPAGTIPAASTQPPRPQVLDLSKPHPIPFVGREPELAQIEAFLADPDCRLLSLVGPGGVGKTRLATQTALRLRTRFAHGSIVVPFAAVHNASEMVSAIAGGLGITLTGKSDPREQLLVAIQDRELLLTLDNLEHLIDGAELITAILDAAPRVNILVTSRERLNLRAEWLLEVTGMDYPRSDAQLQTVLLDISIANDYSALRFFSQQTKRVQPNYTLSHTTVIDAVRLCQLVDGLPLALELAAAWMHRMLCSQILESLQRNLDTLATTLRDVPERHRSMRAVFDHSWQLLTPAEQTFFQSLAVFRGSFPAEAARAIIADEQVSALQGRQLHDTADSILQSLADKSLLRSQVNGRYDLHELARQYAAMRAAHDPHMLPRLHAQHGQYYAAQMQNWMQQYVGVAQRTTLSRMAAEIDNLRAAWQWALESRAVVVLEQLLPGLSLFYDYQGRYNDGYDLFERAVIVASHQTELPKRLHGLLLTHQALFAERLGRYATGSALAQQAAQYLTPVADTADLALAYAVQGRSIERQGNYLEAAAIFEHSLVLYQRIQHAAGIASAFYHLGSVAEGLREYEKARTLTEESLARRSELGDRRGMAFALNNLGIVLEMLGDYEEANRLYRESLAVFGDLGDSNSILLPLSNLGDVAVTLKQYATARSYYQQGLHIALQHLNTPKMMMLLVKMALLQTQIGEHEAALELLALPLNNPTTEQQFRAMAEDALAQMRTRLPEQLISTALERGVQRALSEAVAVQE